MVVDLPLQGEWTVWNAPAGGSGRHNASDRLGQRFSFDFVRLDERTGQMHPKGVLAHVLGRVRADECCSWGQPVVAPGRGLVVRVQDGWPDRQNLCLTRDFLGVLFPPKPRLGSLAPVAGNFIIIECDGGYAFMAHLRDGSIAVREGESVHKGQPIAEVGNSGNSTGPHLHFHLMSAADPRIARGLPCSFRQYERWDGAEWVVVHEGVPSRFERIRNIT